MEPNPRLDNLCHIMVGLILVIHMPGSSDLAMISPREMCTANLMRDIVRESSLQRLDLHTAAILLTRTNQHLSVFHLPVNHCTMEYPTVSLAPHRATHLNHQIDFGSHHYIPNNSSSVEDRQGADRVKRARPLHRSPITVAPVLLSLKLDDPDL